MESYANLTSTIILVLPMGCDYYCPTARRLADHNNDKRHPSYTRGVKSQTAISIWNYYQCGVPAGMFDPPRRRSRRVRSKSLKDFGEPVWDTTHFETNYRSELLYSKETRDLPSRALLQSPWTPRHAAGTAYKAPAVSNRRRLFTTLGNIIKC